MLFFEHIGLNHDSLVNNQNKYIDGGNIMAVKMTKAEAMKLSKAINQNWQKDKLNPKNLKK